MTRFKIRAVAPLLALLSAGISPALSAPQEIVVLGDSLTAGYGVAPGEAFPEQLEAALQARGHDVRVVNAGVSGDTASGGLARLEWSVPAEAQIVIVELGANDMLRGIDPAVTRKAISEIVQKLRARGQTVLLAGMLASPNLGAGYADAFNAIYTDVAAEEGVTLYPFFLDGVAADASLNQADGMHPNAAGVARIVTAILPTVEKLVTAGSSGG